MNPTGQATESAGPPVRAAVTVPDTLETRIGTLAFRDGMPSNETLDKVYDHLDFARAFDAFMNTYQGVNTHGLRRGFLEAGIGDNELIIYPELIDSRSLYLTANSDTVYGGGFLDLSQGPVVVESPPGFLGAINDYWGGWVVDVGVPGCDRGLGGRYLIVPEGYDGPLPEGGFFVATSRTTHLLLFGRLFLRDDDPGPAADLLRRSFKVYPYQAGAVGTSFAAFLRGEARLGPVAPPPETVIHEGCLVDTIPPSDFSYFEWLDDVVQSQPACSLDPELMAPIAAIGIVKGKPFAPDERMKRILTEAAAVAGATARSLFMRPRDPEWYYYPGSGWLPLTLTISGYDFTTPPPAIEGPVHDGVRTPTGVKTFPPTGYRMLDARTCFYYGIMAISPAEGMLLSGIGSQYLMTTVDSHQEYLDGSRTYRLTLPGPIPAKNFWSLTLYDPQSRAMLRTPQRWPRAGSQGYPSPAAEAEADGSVTVYFAPEQPEGVPRGNWIETLPDRGWFVLLRLYGPLEPYFDKSWRAGEVEPVT